MYRNPICIALIATCICLYGCATADQGQAQRANDQTTGGVTVIVNPIGSAAPTGAVDWNRLYDQADSADAKVELFTEMIEYAKSSNIELDEDFQALYDSAENDGAKDAIVKQLAAVLAETSGASAPNRIDIAGTTVNVTVSNSGTSDQAATGGAQSPQNEVPIDVSGNLTGR